MSAVPVWRFSPASSSSTMAFIARSSCGVAALSASLALGASEADGALHALQELLAQGGGHQHAGLELQDAGVEGGEDSPHPVLVEMLHHRLGAFGVVELETHHDAALAAAGRKGGRE